MGSDAIPSEVKRFIDRHLSSFVQLETLILLIDSARSMTPSDVARHLRIDADHAETQLRALARSRIVRVADDGFVYAPADRELRGAAERLAVLYRTHRVAITSAIYARPDEPIRSFSDAFRIRKDAE